MPLLHCIHVTIGYIRPSAIHQPWQTPLDQFISRCNPLRQPCDKIRLVIFRETNYTSLLTLKMCVCKRQVINYWYRDSEVWLSEALCGASPSDFSFKFLFHIARHLSFFINENTREVDCENTKSDKAFLQFNS